jgi:hypothetical protein
VICVSMQNMDNTYDDTSSIATSVDNLTE